MTTDNPSAPTLREVVQKMTPLEKTVTVAHLNAGMECNGAETLDAMLGDNMKGTTSCSCPRARRRCGCARRRSGG